MRYWIPPALWTAVILAASSDALSAGHTAPWLETIINATLGHPLLPQQFDLLHAAVRKGAHLTEYAILGALLFRAIRGGRPLRWSVRWSVTAIGVAAVVAAVDEWHQTFVPSRSGSPWDVVIDIAGAVLAQILIRAAQVLFFIT